MTKARALEIILSLRNVSAAMADDLNLLGQLIEREGIGEETPTPPRLVTVDEPRGESLLKRLKEVSQ